MEKKSLVDVRENNKKLVLDLILKNPGISRLELAKLSHLSGGTITSLINELIEMDKVLETKKRASTGGRPKIGLEIVKPDFVNAIFEIKQRSMIFKLFKNEDLVKERFLRMYYLNGNTIIDTITIILDSLHVELNHVGILLEENIDDNELNYLFDTSLSQDSISFEMALKSKISTTVTVERNLKYLLSEEVMNVTLDQVKLFAYVSINEQLMTQVFDNNALLGFSNKTESVFSLRKYFEINKKLEKWQSLANIHNTQKPVNQNKSLDTNYKRFVVLLSEAIKALLLFYPLDAIFLVGKSRLFPNLDKDLFRNIDEESNLKLIQTVIPTSIDVASNLNRIILKQKLIGGK